MGQLGLLKLKGIVLEKLFYSKKPGQAACSQPIGTYGFSFPMLQTGGMR